MVNNVLRDPIYYRTLVYIKTNLLNLRAHTSLYIMVQTHSMINSTQRQ